MASMTDLDLLAFARDGFVVIPDVVPEPLLAAADAEIDGLVETTEPDEGDGGPGVNAWFLPRARLPRCEALLRDSPALTVANEFVAPGRPRLRLRPRPGVDHPGAVAPRSRWSAHRRSHPSAGRGRRRTRSRCSPASCSPTRPASSPATSGSGPGRTSRTSSSSASAAPRVLIDAYGHSTLLQPPFTLGPPEPVRGRRGDLVLAHFLLGHNKGGHTGTSDRRTVYYRLAAPGHAARWEDTFLDPWLEYPPIAGLASAT